MKAIVYSNYGSPDVLKCEEIEKPTAGDDEVLIKVRAASVNPLDWHYMRGTPYIVRIMTGLRKPKITRLGSSRNHLWRFSTGEELATASLVVGI
jgi:NADPH:quinone reductase-like Zn-dependent oxidoreductase